MAEWLTLDEAFPDVPPHLRTLFAPLQAAAAVVDHGRAIAEQKPPATRNPADVQQLAVLVAILCGRADAYRRDIDPQAWAQQIATWFREARQEGALLS
jgi:hypothetical protein